MKHLKRAILSMLTMAVFFAVNAQASLLLPDHGRGCENPLLRTFLKYQVSATYYKKNVELPLPISEINRKLAEAGLDTLPLEVTLGVKSAKDWKKWSALIEKAKVLTDKEFEINIDRKYLHELPVMCYSGSPAAVMELIEKLGGTFFHEDQGYYATRWGREVDNKDPDNFGSTEAETRERFGEHEDVLEEWFNYNKSSRDVLILSNFGPQGDGTELKLTRIRPCANI